MSDLARAFLVQFGVVEFAEQARAVEVGDGGVKEMAEGDELAALLGHVPEAQIAGRNGGRGPIGEAATGAVPGDGCAAARGRLGRGPQVAFLLRRVEGGIRSFLAPC